MSATVYNAGEGATVKYIRKYYKKASGYLTVYLALTIAVLLPLCMTLIEGARMRTFYFEAECVTDIGINSIFAEYHRELLEKYNLFGIDSSYGTSYSSKTNTEQHLKEYMERNMSYDNVFLSDYIYRDFIGMYPESVELTKIRYLSDGDGTVFRQRAAEAVKDDIGLETLSEIKEWLSEVEYNNLDTRDVAGEKHSIDESIEQMVEEAHSDNKKEITKADGTIEIVEESYEPYESPTEFLEVKRKEGILKHVIDNTDEISAKTISTDNLIAARMENDNISKGNITISDSNTLEEMTERFLFQEYLLKYMDCYVNTDKVSENGELDTDRDKERALDYQIEYLIAGKTSDLENLRSVANRLCLLREAANAAYIFTDETKCEEAELLATVNAALVQVPEIESLLKESILLGWAYAESLYDVKTIFSGGKIPLMKDQSTWHYSLQGMLSSDNDNLYGSSDGLSYTDYLRIFMFLTGEDTLTKRAMNMVEADIRQTDGNEAFRLDACIDMAEINAMTDSAYGYSCEVVRTMSY
jgi:hypothetical protein